MKNNEKDRARPRQWDCSAYSLGDVPPPAAGSLDAAGKVVLIEGRYLSCHDRMPEGLAKEDHLIQFDAPKMYKKYNNTFDIDDVPQEDRQEAAPQVANNVLLQLGCADPV